MNKQEILETVKSLANSQGFYTRLYEHLSDNTEESEEYLNMLEEKKFKDPVDLILYFES